MTFPVDNAPRYQPWYTEAPTEEQEAEMDRLAEDAEGGGTGGGGAEASSEELDGLQQKAKKIDMDVHNAAAIKATTKEFVKLLVEDGKLDLPGKMKLWRLLLLMFL